MKRTNSQKGITLIALIITIVVLMILAAVTINSIQNDGIVGKAQEARDKYEQAKEDEQGVLDGYLEKLELASIPEVNTSEVTAGAAFTTTTKVKDEKGKTFVVPEGYAIVKDDTTENKVLVDEGVVIKDSKGNEWVWVPAVVSEISEVVDGRNVGKLYNFTETGATPITYSADGYREPDVVTKEVYIDYNADALKYIDGADTKAENLNIVLEGEYAKTKTAASFKAQLQEEFDNMVESITKYGGYYIGRYEAKGTIENPVLTLNGGSSITVGMDPNSRWYEVYVCAKKLAANEKVITGMIWGCQWDNTLRWLVSSGDRTWEDLQDMSYTFGDGEEYGLYYKKTNNIYDLSGSLVDYTLEASGALYRVLRGADGAVYGRSSYAEE